MAVDCCRIEVTGGSVDSIYAVPEWIVETGPRLFTGLVADNCCQLL